MLTATPSSTATLPPTPTPPATPPSHEKAVEPQLAITSVVSTLTGAKKVIYEITGTQVGVTDPPWMIYVVAKPKGSDKGGGWWVSGQVVPDAQGTWRARVVANIRPRGTIEVTPLLIKSPAAEPTPVPILTTPAPGQSPTPPPMDTVASIEDVLAEGGPRSDVVERAFAPFAIPVSP